MSKPKKTKPKSEQGNKVKELYKEVSTLSENITFSNNADKITKEDWDSIAWSASRAAEKIRDKRGLPNFDYTVLHKLRGIVLDTDQTIGVLKIINPAKILGVIKEAITRINNFQGEIDSLRGNLREIVWTDRVAEENIHSADFTSVIWNGTNYQFNKTQAECVKLLWQEYKKGALTLSEKTIGEEIGSDADNFRLIHVFRNHKSKGLHPAWGRMIVKRSKGIYGLVVHSEKN